MNMLTLKHANQRVHRAFTLVELLIVIVVVGILATISAVMYEGATSKAVDKQLMSDLNKVSDQLELDFIDNKLYPATLSDANSGAGIDVTSGTDLAYLPSQSRKAYCLNASSSESGSNAYYVTQDGIVKQGVCTVPASSPDAPSYLNGSATCYGAGGYDSEGSVTLTWPTVSNTTIPNYRISINGGGNQEPSVDVTNTTSSPSTLSKTFTVGPFSYDVGQNYHFKVRAVTAGGTESADSPEWSVTFLPYDC